mmetsp:Transcript_32213/g.57788  ORF Transcript_32213/g.57788 Transcript_32213/m.57788 type:complete len:82 (+) Transcript_32213:369-614(+)
MFFSTWQAASKSCSFRSNRCNRLPTAAEGEWKAISPTVQPPGHVFPTTIATTNQVYTAPESPFYQQPPKQFLNILRNERTK